jgi:protein involved in polysaccharide export with SLBB domain
MASGTLDKVAFQPLATRAELQSLARRLSGKNSELSARVHTRLTEGDFRPGERILLLVQGQEALSDTFVVTTGRELMLPAPTVGTLSMKGVLRSELDAHMKKYIARFLEHPVVQARPLIRLSVQGEVAKGGVYPVPADGSLSDALMAAGGTTQYAKVKKIRIERGGDRLWEGNSLETTINELALQDGDQIVIGGRRPGQLNENLRFVALVIGIVGGVYGLTKAF